MTRSHGDGTFSPDDFASLGDGCVLENGVMVFHADTVHLGINVYIGHQAILKGYYKNEMHIGDDSWIGQQCFFHSAGGLHIGNRVGIGPGVRIITSQHIDQGRHQPILKSPLSFAPVVIGDDVDIGVGTTVLPGVTIGKGAIIGAGALIREDVPEYAIVAGVPGRILRYRDE